MLMGRDVSMDRPAGGIAGQMLPGISKRITGAQSESEGNMPEMTPEELTRLSTLEVSTKELQVRVDFYDRILDRMDKSLSQNSESLKALVRLEEKHQSLDKEAASIASTLESEIQKRQKENDDLFKRIRDMEGSSSLSSHFRSILEKVILVVGGAAIYSFIASNSSLT